MPLLLVIIGIYNVIIALDQSASCVESKYHTPELPSQQTVPKHAWMQVTCRANITACQQVWICKAKAKAAEFKFLKEERIV